jgi:2-(1,2-epoxy-1,2-dihydrophenyl)acetyl-CoA isomerase
MTTAHALAARLAGGPTIAYGLMRQSVADCLEMDMTDALSLERRHQKVAGLSADHEEGVAAFLQKRKPVFTGK